MEYEKCQGCREPTKRFAGFYDRQMADGTIQGGMIFSCKSKSCPEALAARAAYEQSMAEQREARRMNSANGICPSGARQDRIDAEITTLAMARELGVSPALVCDWEQERKPWPLEMYERYMAAIERTETA